MLGRLVGLVFGLAVAAFGFGLYKPDLAAKYVRQIDFHTIPLGPFGAYRTIIAVLIMAFGVIVALAALQRSSKKAARQAAPLLGTADAEPEAAHSIDRFPETPPVAASHDDHGHDDHGRDDHGHDAHGHDDHAHDDHGHGHDDHAHDDHGHGHDDHAHAKEPAHH